MALDVEWSQEAEFQLDDIIAYLEYRWTAKEIKKFFAKLEKAINTISETPELHKVSTRRENLREFQITKHTTLFYTFNQNKVFIMLLWSNAMNPE